MSDREDKSEKKSGFRRSVVEWGLMLLVAGSLYVTGYHTEVIGLAQRGLLATGLIQPSYELNEEKMEIAGTQFYFADADFTTRNIGQYRGKVVFLNIWASWCPPCIAEMPSIESLYAQFKNDEDVVFKLGIE